MEIIRIIDMTDKTFRNARNELQIRRIENRVICIIIYFEIYIISINIHGININVIYNYRLIINYNYNSNYDINS